MTIINVSVAKVSKVNKMWVITGIITQKYRNTLLHRFTSREKSCMLRPM